MVDVGVILLHKGNIYVNAAGLNVSFVAHQHAAKPGRRGKSAPCVPPLSVEETYQAFSSPPAGTHRFRKLKRSQKRDLSALFFLLPSEVCLFTSVRRYHHRRTTQRMACRSLDPSASDAICNSSAFQRGARLVQVLIGVPLNNLSL